MPILKPLTTLKLASKTISIVVLSEFGGNKKYALPIRTIRNRIGIASPSFILESTVTVVVYLFTV
jgi:hypothetical protein